MKKTKSDIEKYYGENAVMHGITQVFIPGKGWTKAPMTGEYVVNGAPMLTPTNGGLFAAFMAQATHVQFCIHTATGHRYPDYAISELAEQF